MKPAQFEYHRPETVDEVVALLAQYGDEAKLLAGGQSLVPVLALRLAQFEALIDLNGVAELDFIREDAGALTVGAMTRQVRVQNDPLVARLAPALHLATNHIGHFQIRNRGTIGGSVSHADPAAEYPAVTLALDATMNLVSASGRRQVPAREFFEGPMMTVVGEQELLESISFPTWTGSAGFAVQEVARRAGDFAMVGVVAGVQLSGGRIDRAALALFGVGSSPLRLDDAEARLVGALPDDLDLVDLGKGAVSGVSATSDVHASAEYRIDVAGHLISTALASALKDAAA